MHFENSVILSHEIAQVNTFKGVQNSSYGHQSVVMKGFNCKINTIDCISESSKTNTFMQLKCTSDSVQITLEFDDH